MQSITYKVISDNAEIAAHINHVAAIAEFNGCPKRLETFALVSGLTRSGYGIIASGPTPDLPALSGLDRS